jgi:hypothetical protein
MSTLAAWFTFICGIIPVFSKIFLEQKTSGKEKISYLILVFFMILATLAGTKKITDDDNAAKIVQKRLDDTKTQLTEANEKLTEIDRKAGKIDTTVSKLAEIKSACENLHPNNKKSSIEEKQNMSQACDEFTKIYEDSNLTQATEKNKITVDWYIKINDDLKIKPYLKSLGLNIVSSKNSIPNVHSSNSIWYGSEVNPLQVKATAYTLIASGGKLRMIRRFYNSPKKARTIELAGDSTCKGPLLKVESIAKMENFRHKKLENEPCPESL